MKEVLCLNPKMMLYPRISEHEMECEIEKGIVKTRYEHMRKDNESEFEVNETCDLERGVINYKSLRATDLPTNPRLKLPKPTTIRQESAVEEIKHKMLEKVQEYVKSECDDKGFPKSNLTKNEKDGMAKVKKKIENKEMVIFKTDKSGKLTADSIENYRKSLEVHTVKDKKIDSKEVQAIELEMNRQTKIFNRMFSLGQDHPRDKERIDIASTSSNVPPPALYGLRKDHKPSPPGTQTGPLGGQYVEQRMPPIAEQVVFYVG